ncbi:MAG: hypothetical protein ACE5GD_01860 [Candidatus Geothermarchaeales archaeon]
MLKQAERSNVLAILALALILFAVGAAILVGSYWAGDVGAASKIGGLSAIFIGVAFIIFYIILKKRSGPKTRS